MRILLLLFFPFLLSAQVSPLYSEVTPIPSAVTNNAVAYANIADTTFIYSFAGLDSTKLWSGIHLKAWRLNLVNQVWQSIPPVPDPLGGKIAAGASTVKNKIYVIGGYHVAQNGSEVSSNKVHRYDPIANTWLSDGAPIPKAIDDHVQAVWRDSLIFVVTGWSNTTNVPNVQVYNPATDTWAAGTSVPNTNNYKVFGGSGVIVGDTLYYCGGASAGTNFPATSYFRKGYINPNNPLDITWSGFSSPAAKGYRMAAATMGGVAVWIGGSDITYNYDGIAYNGSGGVPSLARVKTYSNFNPTLQYGLGESQGLFGAPAIMDLRGVAQIFPDYFYTIGGMEPGQKVSNKVYQYNWEYALNNTDIYSNAAVRIAPNPAHHYFRIDLDGAFDLELLSPNGVVCRRLSGVNTLEVPTKGLADGTYGVKIMQNNKVYAVQQVVILN
jgi:Kelch motif